MPWGQAMRFSGSGSVSKLSHYRFSTSPAWALHQWKLAKRRRPLPARKAGNLHQIAVQ